MPGALKSVLEPIFEKDFVAFSYGFRPEKSAQPALERVKALLRSGHACIVDADLKRYFDLIPHDRLMPMLRERIADGLVLQLIQKYLDAGVLEEGKGWERSAAGTPQGSVISPLLSNIYLNPLDHEMDRRGWKLVRYADDFVVLCRSREEAECGLKWLAEWTQNAGLSLHPTKTRLVEVAHEGFDFLEWHFCGGKKWPRKKSVQKLQEKLRPLTRRTNGMSLEAIVARVNPILRGWRNYFRDSQPSSLSGPDGCLRRRLRALLRKRDKRPGFGLSHADSKRWPNRWFAEQGLDSLEHGSCTYR